MRVTSPSCPCWFLACRVGRLRVRVCAGVLGVLEIKCVLRRRVERVQRVRRVERVERVGGGFEPKHQLPPSTRLSISISISYLIETSKYRVLMFFSKVF